MQLALKSGRRTEAQIADFQSQFQQMVATGFFKAPELNWERVLQRGQGLSRAHSAACSARSLDILHVASAMELGVREFWTFDSRQKTLARKVGLRVNGEEG
jgi:predicted nucleic acid-binding protein